MPRKPKPRLRWNPEQTLKLFHANGIDTRHELAKALSVSRSTVYAAFDDTWSGYATENMLAQLHAHFGADIGQLVLTNRSVRKPRLTDGVA